MSYIIEKNSPLIPIKLTTKGRQKIASGNLNWSYFALGDSEIDYRYLDIPDEFGKLNILKPKDRQPALKTFVEKDSCVVLHELSNSDKRVIECCVKNEAKTRGVFSGTDIDTMLLQTGETYIRTTGQVQLSQMNGTNSIDLNTVDFEDGDYILFKIAKPNTGALSLTETQVPVLYLWYKIDKTNLSTIVTLDRVLPYFAFMTSVEVNFYIFPKGESILEYYGSGTTIPYWNSETLEFSSDCDITQEDVCIMNMNNVWNETLAGTYSTHEDHNYYGSIDYVGQKEYFGYNIDCPEVVDESLDCEDKLASVDDDFVKGISIIHFTNLNISNEYGEQYYINHAEKNHLKVKLPTIMWHRRDFSGSEVGNLLGMGFITTGDTKIVPNSQIEYYDLIEDPSYISISGTPITVGRVFPNLKVVVIHDEELLAVMSYKSSRNHTLPKLKGRMVSPVGGIGTGVLAKGKTMYMTYVFESNNGVKYTLPHQKYLKFNNISKIDRDIEFSIAELNMLPYMRHIEKSGYDGLGWYAHMFKVLVQIVDSQDDRPSPENWVTIDYTSNLISNVSNYTIDPLLLEKQDSVTLGFTLDKSKYDGGYNYFLSNLEIPEVNCTEELQFGDERFLFGNVETWIGACIERVIFDIKLNTNDFVKTNNPTWDTVSELYFNEIGIYDSTQELVAIAKISRPIELTKNTKFSIEVSLDL